MTIALTGFVTADFRPCTNGQWGLVAQAFEVVDTTHAAGPLFAFFAKGRRDALRIAGFDSVEISWYKQHRTRPCTNRKDWAPAVSDREAIRNERPDHPPSMPLFDKLFRLLLPVLLLSTAMARDEVDSTTCSDEDYAIFSSLLSNLYAAHKGGALSLIGLTKVDPVLSGRYQISKASEAFLADVPEGVKRTFYERNVRRAIIRAERIQTQIEISPINEDYESLLASRDGWERFRRDHPESIGIVRLSLPGVDRRERNAMIYAALYCGPLCGGGTLFTLSKQDGKWRVVKSMTIWQS